MIGHDLSNIYLKKKGIRKRVSSYDKTGGNDDRIYIKPNEDRLNVYLSGANTYAIVCISYICK